MTELHAHLAISCTHGPTAALAPRSRTSCLACQLLEKGVTNTCKDCERTLLDSFRFCSLGCKIVDTSNDPDKMKKRMKNRVTTTSGSEETYSSTSHGSEKSTVVHSLNPSTPLPIVVSFRSTTRRKGILHRAPFSSLILEF
ncbi:uncharacterized protein LOC110100857 [Dendrobium catenatum]|uniref:uncharacterized protein LOC110100857 n=1 Tax=Dendrobium catenatum TaxID=906689 RepID=UPI0009F6D2FF|nr:uncharacterized protein LOC110100857 [Dendrobium catenatum]